MSDDDPFADDGDTDKTIIRPNPGGRRPAAAPVGDPAPQAAGQRAPQRPIAPGEVVAIARIGINNLVGAASSLLGLAVRLRNRAQCKDVEALRDSVVAEIKKFEQAALTAGEPAQSVRIARYALCATIDDLVLNTPWGSQSAWTRQSLVGTFHNETHGGERFYELLEQMQKDPARNRDILELLYLCLSLGFEGRLRVEARGANTHAQLRDSLLRTIRAQRGEIERDLSPHWHGVAAGHRPLASFIPLWMVAVVTVAILSLTYVGFSYALNASSDRLYGQFNALPPTGAVELARAVPAPPPPPPPPKTEPGLVERVRGFLEPEVAAGLVEVFENANAVTVRLRSEGLFASGSDRIQDGYLNTLTRVGEALARESGKVIVAGHSDNVPIRTVRFPSNFHLSLARADSVLKLLARALPDANRLSAEGRAENEPIASNATVEGRARNRRIEVILLKSG